MIPLPVTVREPAPLFPCGAQSRKGEPPSNLSRSAEGNWCVWQFGMLVSLTFTYQACCPMGWRKWPRLGMFVEFVPSSLPQGGFEKADCKSWLFHNRAEKLREQKSLGLGGLPDLLPDVTHFNVFISIRNSIHNKGFDYDVVYFIYTNSPFPPFPLSSANPLLFPTAPPLSQLFLGGRGAQCFISEVVSCNMGERFVCRDLCVLSVTILLRKVAVPVPP